MRSSTGNAGIGDAGDVPGDNAIVDTVSAEIIGVLDAIDLPIVVVGRDCKLVRLNQAAADTLGLTPSDVGRLPGNIQALAEVKDLEKLCARVIADGSPYRHDIRVGDRLFLLRISPYAGSDGQMRGAALTFTNVTAFRESIAQAVYEREYTKAILNTVEPLVVLDAELRVQTANRAFYELFAISREASQGVSLCDLGAGDWKDSGLPASLQAVLAEGNKFQTIEVQREFPTVGRRTVLLDARRLSREGQVLILLVLRDVTERKQAEDALRKSEERFRALITATSDVIYRMSADWREMRRLDGRDFIADTTDPSGTWLAKYIHPDDQPQVLATIHEAIRTKSIFELEHRVFRVDGTLGWTFSRAIPLLDAKGEIIEWFGAASDITKRRRAEETLRESEAQFRQLANAMPQIVWTARPDGYVDYYNERWYEYTGFPRGEFGQSSWEKILHPGDLQRCVDTYFGCIREGKPYQIEYRFKDHGTGGYRWFMGRALPIRNEQNEIIRWFGTCTDIDDQKRSAEKLELAVTERTTKLRESIDELEAFSFSIAHDLRAPLRSMQGFSDILLEDYNDKIDSAGQGYLRRIGTSADRMDRLIQDILNYSKVIRAELPLESVDMENLLQGMFETYPMFLSETADIQIQGKIPRVLGNVAALTQVFSNLLGNAVKFVAPGSKPRVRISAEKRERRVRILVQDNGIGIASDQHEKIFAIFQRVDKSYEGTGIGLAIVKKAIERMGGEVGVVSELGRGSLFWVELTTV